MGWCSVTSYTLRRSLKQSRNALESIWAASRLAAISGPQPFSGVSEINLKCARRIILRHFFVPAASSESARSNTRDVCDIASLPSIHAVLITALPRLKSGNGGNFWQRNYFLRPLTDHLDLSNCKLSARAGQKKGSAPTSIGAVAPGSFAAPSPQRVGSNT